MNLSALGNWIEDNNAEPLVTIIIAIIGWLIVVWNVNRQLRKNRELDSEKFKRELQIKTADEAIRLLMVLRNRYLDFKMFIYYPGTKDDLQRYSELLLDNWETVHEAYMEFIYFFESREVILHKFRSMRDEFKTKGDELSKAIFSYSETVLLHLSDLTKDHRKDFLEEKELIQELIYDLQAYIYDFNNELQNAFLSDYFGYRIPKREPLDESYKFLTVESKKKK